MTFWKKNKSSLSDRITQIELNSKRNADLLKEQGVVLVEIKEKMSLITSVFLKTESMFGFYCEKCKMYSFSSSKIKKCQKCSNGFSINGKTN